MAKEPDEYLDDDLPELTDAELAEMRPARQVLSAEEFAAVSSVRRGRPKLARPKVPVTIRMDPVTLDAFKATGRGWQTRVNLALTKLAASELGGTLKTKDGHRVTLKAGTLKAKARAKAKAKADLKEAEAAARRRTSSKVA